MALAKEQFQSNHHKDGATGKEGKADYRHPHTALGKVEMVVHL
jgi:hypothetical protein